MQSNFVIRYLFLAFIIIGQLANTTPTKAQGVAIYVETTADTLLNDGFCSLREAITNANNNAQTRADCEAGFGDDGIYFSPSLGTATITLTSSLPTLTDPNGLSIDGNSTITINGANLYRIFTNGTNVPLTINNINLENGSALFGAAIYNRGILTVSNVNFKSNIASSFGGAILTQTNNLVTISNSMFQGNSASLTGGGAIGIEQNSAVLITKSKFLGNSSSSGNGGAIYNAYETTLSILNSTFDSNSANAYGGAITSSGLTTISNSTFYKNSTDTMGGATYVAQGTTSILNSTFSNNTAAINGGAVSTGNTASVIIKNSILANSNDGTNIINDCYNNIVTGSMTGNNNLIMQDAAGLNSCGFLDGVNGNIVGADPLLDSLSLNGGITESMRLQVGSPAIDTGDNNSCAQLPSNNVDQRGVARPLDGDNNSTSICDIGSYELENPPYVISIVRADASPTSASSVNYIIKFSRPVTGVSIDDFSLVFLSSTFNGVITNLSGSSDTYIISVDTSLNINSKFRLDLSDNDSIKDTNNITLGGLGMFNGNFFGEEYFIFHPTFLDVPLNAFAWAHIESIYTAGITGGCSTNPLTYCPTATVTRAQMAVFLMRGMFGSSYTPTPASGTIFNDVPANSFAAAYIEAFAYQGITGGCGAGNYCPNNHVTRAQMAIFLLRAKHGYNYNPPTATGTMFNDVPLGSFADAWIEQLANEGITGGCGGNNYCPNNPITRAQMAIFLQRTFNLVLP